MATYVCYERPNAKSDNDAISYIVLINYIPFTQSRNARVTRPFIFYGKGRLQQTTPELTMQACVP